MSVRIILRRRALRLVQAAGCAAIALAFAGCTALPSSSAPMPFDVSVPDADPVDLSADGPTADSDPNALVTDFLLACAAGPNDGFATARLFLTKTSAQNWEPEAEILVYDTASSPRLDVLGDVNGDSVEVGLSAPAVASVDSDGVMTLASESDVATTFSLVKENGQWRINAPDNALIISRASFIASYSLVDLYFPAVTGDALVPDPRWYPSRRLAGHLLLGLVDGPRPTLADAVSTAIPKGTTIPAQGVETVDRISKVTLDSVIPEDPTTRALIGWQVLTTLMQDPRVTTLQLVVSGEEIPLTGLPQGPGYALDTRVALSESSIGFLTGTAFAPVSLPVSPSPTAVSPALSPVSRDLFAWRDGASLIIAEGGAAPASSSLNVDGDAAPSIDRFGWVWSSGPNGANAVTAARSTGEVVTVVGGGESLAGTKRIAISPDGARALVLAESSAGKGLSVWTVKRDASGAPVSLSHPEPIPGFESGVIDSSWVGSTTVLAAIPNPATGIPGGASNAVGLRFVDIGGLTATSSAPEGTVEVSGGSTRASVCVTGLGSTVECRSGALWQTMPSTVRSARFPG